MSRSFKHLLIHLHIACFAMLGMVSYAQALPVGQVVAQAATFDAQKARYTKLMSKRKTLEKSLSELEVQYAGLAKNIDKVKRKGVSTLNRSEIQALLRRGRKLAQRLSKVQSDIKTVDTNLQATARVLLRQINVQMKRIERTLPGQRGAARKQSITKLNALSKQRSLYSRPLPQVDYKKLKSMLAMAEGLDNPDDMIALADELQDAEEGVRKKLTWIAKRLKELKARKRLLRRAQAFSKQERFFEESARGRQVGRVATRRVKAKTNTKQDVDLNAGLESDSQNNSNTPGFSADPAAPQRGSDDYVETPNNTPAVTPPTSDDPFTSTKETVIISKEADPRTVSTRRTSRSDGTLDKRIKSLERDRKTLKRQADALKKKAKSLRKEANALD